MTVEQRVDRIAARAYAPLATPVRLAAAIGAGVAADVALDPVHRHLPLCPFHAMTGRLCPLCGGLRSVDALVHGQWAAAVHDNALFVAALPMLVLAWVAWLRRPDAGQSRRPGRRAVWVGVTALSVTLSVAFTVVRNLPFATGLRP